jgi:hypothetical protein
LRPPDPPVSNLHPSLLRISAAGARRDRWQDRLIAPRRLPGQRGFVGEPESLGAGLVPGVAGIALVPLPVVLDDGPAPTAGAADGAVPRLLLDLGAGGGLDEPELGPLSQATSARVANVALTAMIVFFMVGLSE